MKKVGIITFHCADNFGAVLQVYSLQAVIRENGFYPEIIDFKPSRVMNNYTLLPVLKESIKQRGYKGTLKEYILRLMNIRNNHTRIKAFEDFRRNHLKLSSNSYTLASELYKDTPRYDLYITGSDQVWNPSFFSKIGNSYFLDFAIDDSIKISYAASIAVKVNDHYMKNFEQHINKFDYISVREKSSKDFISQFTDREVFVTLDPSLLSTQDTWKKISTFSTTKDKFILVYDLVKDPMIVSIANKVAKKYDCKIISYSNRKGYDNWHSSFSSSNPTEFLGLFQNAEFIVTSSFHGTAFAIIFNKPFYTIPHPTRGSRMIDLLSDLDLNDRIIKGNSIIQSINEDIDYYEVNKKLTALRERSLTFLKNALNRN